MSDFALESVRGLVEAYAAQVLPPPAPQAPPVVNASRWNAVRHGLTSRRVVLSAEDLPVYEAHCNGLVETLQPVGLLESQLVQRIADIQWRLLGASAYEANLLALADADNTCRFKGVDEDVERLLSQAFFLRDRTNALANLSLHEQRLQRSLELTMRQLQRSQEARIGRSETAKKKNESTKVE